MKKGKNKVATVEFGKLTRTGALEALTAFQNRHMTAWDLRDAEQWASLTEYVKSSVRVETVRFKFYAGEVIQAMSSLNGVKHDHGEDFPVYTGSFLIVLKDVDFDSKGQPLSDYEDFEHTIKVLVIYNGKNEGTGDLTPSEFQALVGKKLYTLEPGQSFFEDPTLMDDESDDDEQEDLIESLWYFGEAGDNEPSKVKVYSGGRWNVQNIELTGNYIVVRQDEVGLQLEEDVGRKKRIARRIELTYRQLVNRALRVFRKQARKYSR